MCIYPISYHRSCRHITNWYTVLPNTSCGRDEPCSITLRDNCLYFDSIRSRCQSCVRGRGRPEPYTSSMYNRRPTSINPSVADELDSLLWGETFDSKLSTEALDWLANLATIRENDKKIFKWQKEIFRYGDRIERPAGWQRIGEAVTPGSSPKGYTKREQDEILARRYQRMELEQLEQEEKRHREEMPWNKRRG